MPGKPPVQSPGHAFPQTPVTVPVDQADLNNPFRKICYRFLLALVFVRFSMLHQLLTYQLGINLYLLYLLGIPPLIGCAVTGGFRRLIRFRAAFYWMGFAVCLILSSFFSSWVGGSVGVVATYLRADFLMLFAVGGVAVGWKECRALIFTISLSAIMSEVSFRLFAQIDSEGRTNLQFGSIANSNDYAAHLILVLPFLLWAVLSVKSVVFRAIGFLFVMYGGYQILASGSRGAFLALLVTVLAALLIGTPKQRIIGLVAGSVMIVGALSLISPQALQRILSFSADDAKSSQEAIMSSNIRTQLLKDSFVFAATHPLFGLGPGRFGETEGLSRKQHEVGLYFEAHNSFMTVASECGTPALLFYLGGIGSSVFLLNGIRRRVAADPAANDVRNAIFCIKLALVGYCTAILFVNFAYFFYLPALTGLITAMAASFPALAPVSGQFTPQFSRFTAPVRPKFANQLSPPPPDQFPGKPPMRPKVKI